VVNDAKVLVIEQVLLSPAVGVIVPSVAQSPPISAL
jgi:hypothetical protein